MMRQKQMEMFWWLEDKSSRDYGMYKRLLESKIGIPNANARVPGTPTTTTTSTMSHEHQHQRQKTNNDANHVQAQIEAAKMKAQKMLTEEKEKVKKVLEYVEDTSLFDNIVECPAKRSKSQRWISKRHVQRHRRVNRTEERERRVDTAKIKSSRKILRKKEWNYSSTSWSANK